MRSDDEWAKVRRYLMELITVMDRYVGAGCDQQVIDRVGIWAVAMSADTALTVDQYSDAPMDPEVAAASLNALQQFMDWITGQCLYYASKGAEVHARNLPEEEGDDASGTI